MIPVYAPGLYRIHRVFCDRSMSQCCSSACLQLVTRKGEEDVYRDACEQTRQRMTRAQSASVSACAPDSDSNCSSPPLQKLLAWSALSQSQGPHQRASKWAEQSRGKTVSRLTRLPLCHSPAGCPWCSTKNFVKWTDKSSQFQRFLLPWLVSDDIPPRPHPPAWPRQSAFCCFLFFFFFFTIFRPPPSSTALVSFALISMFLNLRNKVSYTQFCYLDAAVKKAATEME